MAISGVKNVAMKAGRGLAKARNQGAKYAAGGIVGRPAMPAQANPRSALGGAGAKGPVTQPVMPPTAMKKGGKTKC
jgi:hypothetical protein